MPTPSRSQALHALPGPPHPMIALTPSPRNGCCITCGVMTHYVCSACTAFAFYCSPEHILQDWTEHGRTCDNSAIVDPDDVNLPDPTTVADDLGVSLASLSIDDHYAAESAACPRVVRDRLRTDRGLYADTKSDNLVFVDIPLIPDVRRLDDSVPCCVPMVFSYLGGMRIGETRVSFGDDLEPRQSPLAVYFTAEKCDTMVDTNTCIANLVKDYLGSHLPWGGPVVVMKGVDDDVSDFCDIDESDVLDIRGFCGRFQ